MDNSSAAIITLLFLLASVFFFSTLDKPIDDMDSKITPPFIVMGNYTKKNITFHVCEGSFELEPNHQLVMDHLTCFEGP